MSQKISLQEAVGKIKDGMTITVDEDGTVTVED